MNAAELAQLHGLCFTIPRPWYATEFDDLLQQNGVFLCQRQDGFALGRMAGPEVELLTLAVHPSKRRQGIGAALLAEFETTARNHHAEQAFLEVAQDNQAARALYATHGYCEAGHRKNYYASAKGPKITAIVMMRNF